MNDPAETDEAGDNRRSPYRQVKLLGIAFFAITLCWAAAAAYTGFIDNSNQEYCDYVGPGESYHLIMDDMPCRITRMAIIEPLLFLIVANIVFQSLTLALWFAVTREERSKQQQPPARSEEPGSDVASFIRRLREATRGEGRR